MTWKLCFFEIKPPVNPGALSDITPLLKRLNDAFGTQKLARLLDVESATLNSYVAGREKMCEEMTQRVLDIHDVLTRTFQVFAPDTAMRWLVGNEPFLAGQRPIDVLASRGIAPLIEALDSIDAGAYA